MEGLFAQIITKDMAILAAASIVVMLFIGKIPLEKKRLNKTKFWKRWGIFLLLLICVGGAFVPGLRPEGEIGNVIVFGLLSTLAAHVGKKVLDPLVLKRLAAHEEKE